MSKKIEKVDPKEFPIGTVVVYETGDHPNNSEFGLGVVVEHLSMDDYFRLFVANNDDDFKEMSSCFCPRYVHPLGLLDDSSQTPEVLIK